MSSKQFKRICAGLLISLIVVIFLFSNQNHEISVHLSDKVAQLLNIRGNKVQEASTIPLVFGLNIRQWAHVVLFASLGLISIILWKKWWKAGLFCYGIAIVDEIHQLFIIGRSAKFSDTLIDAFGFGCVILLWLLSKAFFELIIRKKSKMSEEE